MRCRRAVHQSTCGAPGEGRRPAFTKSMSGRPAIFFRDPDANVLEVAEMGTWRE